MRTARQDAEKQKMDGDFEGRRQKENDNRNSKETRMFISNITYPLAYHSISKEHSTVVTKGRALGIFRPRVCMSQGAAMWLRHRLLRQGVWRKELDAKVTFS